MQDTRWAPQILTDCTPGLVSGSGQGGVRKLQGDVSVCLMQYACSFAATYLLQALLTAPAEDAKHILADRFPACCLQQPQQKRGIRDLLSGLVSEVPKFIQTNAGGSQARFLTSKASSLGLLWGFGI